MGTKRPSWSLFDTLSNINISNSKLQPGGKTSRDPSPRPAMTAQSERERDSKREEDRRSERETEKKREKARNKDMDPRDRYYERDRAPAARPREGEREWRERERRQRDDRSRNGLSHLEKETVREVERATKKGGTFPRTRKRSADRGKEKSSTAKEDEERRDRRQRDGLKRVELDDWERERERAHQRERYRERERDDMRSWGKEEGKNTVEDEKSRKGKRYLESDVVLQDRMRERGDSRDRRERDAGRKREKSRPNIGQREARVPSPRNPRDIYPDQKGKEMTQSRVGRRDTRSEGDSDERERKRERGRYKERQELTYQHSRSEGDDTGKTLREKDPGGQLYREGDRPRYRDGDREVDVSRRKGGEKDGVRYRDVDRQAVREGDRLKENVTDSKYHRREEDRYRQYEQRTGRKEKERAVDLRWDDKTEGSLSQNETAPRAPPRVQSSGEWSSDMDGEMSSRRGRDSHEERVSERESTAESDREVEDQRNKAAQSQRETKRSERQERERGEMTEQRRMWLEPQRGKNSKDGFVNRERHARGNERRSEQERSMESQAEWEREGRRVKEEPDEKYLDQSSYRTRQEGRNEHRGDIEKETKGVSVDGEEVDEVWREVDKGGREHLSDSDEWIEGNWLRDAEGESMTDDTEDSDEEEKGENSYLGRSENKGGSETGGRQERETMLSGEEAFVTLSSGGDDEEEFEDCPEFLEPVAAKRCEGDEERGKEQAVNEEDREKQPKYVFCVIGQTSLSQGDSMGGVGRDNSNTESSDHCSDEAPQQPHRDPSRNYEHPIVNIQDTESKSECDTEERPAAGESAEEDVRHRAPSVGMRSKVENPHAEIGTIKRDSQTEQLLTQWREKNRDGEREQATPVLRNPYEDVCSQVNLEQIQPIMEAINTGAMSPEEVEAIRIRMSGAWSMSEEPKRHSQAPHLKWAKDVVREILGRSEENAVDEPNAEGRRNQEVDQCKTETEDDKQEEDAQLTAEVPVVKLTMHKTHSELEEEEPLEVEGLRGMGQSQNDMHADQFTAMHGGDTPTYTHADALLDTGGKEDHILDTEPEPSGLLKEAAVEEKHRDEGEEVKSSEMEKEVKKEKEVEMYLSVSNTLYKPNSCPILNYETESDLGPSREGEGGQELKDKNDESEEERQGEEPEEKGTVEELGEGHEVDAREGQVFAEKKVAGGTLTSSCSFRDLGPEARLRRRGIRKTTERRNGELVEEEGSVGRDRRTRIFSTTDDDEDDKSKSWGEVELRNVLDTIDRRKRNSRFFNAAQLYQQYSEAAQDFEILRQARSDGISVSEDPAPSPAPSPPPACRPLPPLPEFPHPHSLSHTGSITSIKSLPLPEPPKSEGRPSSPRLSISFTQSSTLWRELPGVRNSTELEELTEDERRLQEVRFEVVTSEASYCRSLDIVVEHFVKSKQLGALLTTQDRNWLFSRLADVRAISHSFLSKLEERVETDIINFTVCDIIARHCQRFKMVYVPYLTNQSYQDATFQRLMNENAGFRRIVEKLERSPVCQRLPLRSFLVLPFQRITRIKLLVQNIVKRTTPGTTEATQAIKSLKLLEKLIQESNDSITQMKSIESLVFLSAKVDFECRTLPLISQSRRLVREGPVTELMDFSLKETERNVYLHLFNDYLLLSLQKEGGRFTVIDHCPVSDLRAENCRVKLHSLQKNLFRLHMTNRTLLLRNETQSDKLRWISAVSWPHPEIDFSAAQDFKQMQCIRAIVSQQPDELSLEKADIILVHQQSSDHWVEGTRLSDRHRGWVPQSHLETITNSRVRQRNLEDALKLTTATAAV